jgi:amino acid adenylation domain-containing protein/non-ribosomal peptide synthase protein (TIGR01720 family)
MVMTAQIPAVGRPPAPPARPSGREFPLAGLGDDDLRRVLAPFEPGTVEDVYALSPLQSGILFHALHRPDRSDYLSQNAYRLAGALDRAAFAGAWERVVDRHPALRTTFAWDGIPHPVQLVHRTFPVQLRYLDWRGSDEEHVAWSLSALLAQVRGTGMRLDRTPPMSFDLIGVGDHDHVFVWHQHHVILDGWSTAIVLSEVLTAYTELCAAASPDTWPQAVPFREHIAWLRDRDHGADLAFWKGSLDGFAATTELPLIHPAPADGQGTAVRVPRTAAAETTRRLRRLARELRITPNAVLQGAWALLLSRHSGDRDVVYGTVMSGRSGDEPGIERMVGMLVNTVPVRLGVDDDAVLHDWLRAVQRRLTDVRRFEHIGLADLRGCSQVRPGESMFETVLNFVSIADPAPVPHAGLTVTPEQVYQQIGYPLGLTVLLRDDLLLQFGYEPERVAAADAERFFAAYEHILEQFAAATPDTRLGDITALPDDERRLVTRDWVGSVGDYPADSTIGELFERVATRQPDAIALVCGDAGGGDVEMTYAQLDAAANRLAHALRRRGVSTETRVGLALPRSLERVVSQLAIVKAGGACLGLDPANPPARLALMIGDSDPGVIVATAATEPAVRAAAAGLTVLVLDDPMTAAEIAAAPEGPPDEVASPLSLAQVCYTSGSTGTPKGVGLAHRGVIRMAFDPSYVRTGPAETYIHLQPIAFDASLIELYVTLLNGARLVVPPPGNLDIPDIAAQVRRHGVTTLGLTSAMFHQMVEYSADALGGVRQMITGGDVVLPEAFAAPLRMYPGMTVVAGYGPTENTVITTSFTANDPEQIGTRVPIGRPVSHTTAYVLDGKMRPVPVGVTGELYTGGHGVARGYLNHPAATADRFGPDPFSTEPGARMYRTGDLARWRADGTLDFLGRADNQVKIRGFRVELGEIEARLSQHPDIAEVVVTARPDPSGHRRLVAYVVAAGQQAPSSAQVRKFAQRELPDYMIPSAVVTLDALPMNANGKVDRAALPEPAEPHGAPGDGTAARTPAEQTLADIWQRILGTTRIGVTDNFFDLGGDSILSIRIASEARAAGLPLTSALLFTHQTIEELAEALTDTPVVVAPDQDPVTGDVPLTPIQSAFFDVGGPYEQFTQSRVLRWSEKAEPGVLRGALSALLAHHDALRLRAVRADGVWRQHLAGTDGDIAHLDVIDLSGTAPGRLEAAVQEAADRVQAGMNLADGPMLRAALFRLGPGQPDHVLIAVHHLAVDLVSWSFLLADLDAAYRAIAAGGACALPPKTASIKAWAQELHRQASSAELDLDLRYWSEPADEAGTIPVDHELGDGTESSVKSVRVALTARQTDTLLHGLRHFAGIRTVDLLVTALARTLREWTGSGTVTVDFESHGRDPLAGRVDVSRTVGWFTSVYPVSFSLPDPDDLDSCLHTVREQLRAVPRHGIAHGIARYLRAPQEPGGDARPAVLRHGQVSFNYLGRYAAELPDGALFTAEPLVWGHETDPCRPRPHLLDVVAHLDGRCLEITWFYSEDLHRGETIRRLASRLLDDLGLLIEHVANAPETGTAQRWRQRMFPGTALAIGPMARFRIPGASFAIADGRGIQAWGSGLADTGTETRVTPDTIFQLGSISKHLTALAVLRLAQDGIVDIDADVNGYLRSWRWPQREGWQPMSLRQLLSHTAGLGSAETPLYRPEETMPGLADLLGCGLIADGVPVRMVHRPGTVYEYAGVNYAVVELVVMDVTRASFADAVARLVLDPLGMKDTGFAREFPAERGDLTAHGHGADGRRYKDPWHDFPSTAAGGMWSTPKDLVRVALEIQAAAQGRGALLTEESVRAMLPRGDHGYGLGTVVKTVNGARWYGHPGDSPGFRSVFAFTLGHDTAVAAFTNGDGGTQMLQDMLGGIELDLIMRVQGERKFT